MRRPRARASSNRSPETRRRIVAAAGEVFAARGLRGATVRAISARAGVNIAAIAYHFGGKERLYEAVLHESYEESLLEHPPQFGVSDFAPAEERLRAFVRSLLLRVFGEGRPAWFGTLMSREMVEPTGALDGLVERGVRPLFELLASIIVDIAGRPFPKPVLHRCVASVLGQCLFYKHAQPVVRRLFVHQRFDRASLDELADHVTRVSLAGIAEAAAHLTRTERARRRKGA
jgi:AcrR family transcriptional regulator